MATYLVLITGVTGFVGFRVLQVVLEHGYYVRAVVRSSAGAHVIHSHPDIKRLLKSDGQLSFVTVPDFLAPHAFDDAFGGVGYVLHVASPLPSKSTEHFEETLTRPAVQGSLAILESARKAGTVRRIVITSSIVAVVPSLALLGLDPSTVYNGDGRIPDMPAPYENSSVAYIASKIAALNHTESWLAQNASLPFDVVHIHPSLVFGRNRLRTSAKDLRSGTNTLPISQALGQLDETSLPVRFNATVHVDDVALVHVRALDFDVVPRINVKPGTIPSRSFLVSQANASPTLWSDFTEIVARRFPQEVATGILPNTGHVDTAEVSLDVRATEQTFGLQLKSFEDTIVDVLQQYVELLE